MLDLYHFGNFERDYINDDNVFECLLGGCYLELNDLVQFCTLFILKEMCKTEKLIHLVHQIDQLKPLVSESDESNHRYADLRSSNF